MYNNVVQCVRCYEESEKSVIRSNVRLVSRLFNVLFNEIQLGRCDELLVQIFFPICHYPCLEPSSYSGSRVILPFWENSSKHIRMVRVVSKYVILSTQEEIDSIPAKVNEPFRTFLLLAQTTNIQNVNVRQCTHTFEKRTASNPIFVVSYSFELLSLSLSSLSISFVLNVLFPSFSHSWV